MEGRFATLLAHRNRCATGFAHQQKLNSAEIRGFCPDGEWPSALARQILPGESCRPGKSFR